MSRDDFMITLKKLLSFLPDRQYVELYFFLRLGRHICWNNPVCLNDKLQWLKFNYRFPLQTIVSDKYAVRKYVEGKIGQKYLIPLLGVWDNFDQIDFSKLPEKFVLKCNHDSGGLAICTDRQSFGIDAAKKKVSRSLKSNFFNVGREYQYKNIIPRIICEQFIGDGKNIPIDYKIYCFNGVPDAILVCKDRFAKNSHRAQYYFFDHEWNFLRYNQGDDVVETPDIPMG